MQWGVESKPCCPILESPSCAWSSQHIGLRAFAQTRFREFFDGLSCLESVKTPVSVEMARINLSLVAAHIFIVILVDSQMYRAKRSPSNLLLYQILVDSVLCGAVVFAVAVLGAGIEGGLQASSRLSVESVWQCGIARGCQLCKKIYATHFHMSVARRCSLVMSERAVVRWGGRGGPGGGQ